MKRTSYSPYVWMLGGSFSFAIMSALAHALRDHCDWQLIALVRTFLVFVFAAALSLSGGAQLVFPGPRTLWIRSIAGSVSLVCTFFALTRLPISDALTLTNMFPLWVAVLSWPLLGEPPTLRVWLSVLMGLGGVCLIQQPHLAEGNLAVLVALLSSFSTAVAMIGLHRLHHLDARSIVVHFSAVSMPICLSALFLLDHPHITESLLDSRTIATLLGVGLAATFGQLLLTKAFAAGPPAKVSVIGLTQIVFAMLLEILVWHRSVNGMTLLGMALVIGPTAWIMLQRG